MKTTPSLLRIHKEGYIFIAIFFICTWILWAITAKLGWLGVVLTCWCIYFFRDPERMVPDGEEYILSPADGLVTQVVDSMLPAELGMSETPVKKISIFLNIFNVHVNRVPAYGKIVKVHYHPGKFINASLDKSSIDNERNNVLMKLKINGEYLVFTQIAGLIARRIVCDLKPAQEVVAGEKYGIIRFGSRMDVYLPEGEHPNVNEGQQVIGGETILAKIGSRGIVSGVIR